MDAVVSWGSTEAPRLGPSCKGRKTRGSGEKIGGEAIQTKEGMMAIGEMEKLLSELSELLETLKFQSRGPERKRLQRRVWQILNRLGSAA